MLGDTWLFRTEKVKMKWVASFRVPVDGCRLPDAGCWLLGAGCWLLVAGCWLLVAGCWLLVAGCWLLVARQAVCFSRRSLARVNAETPPLWGGVPAAAGEPDDDLLSHGQSALSSAWSRFTVLFGMGRGGTDSLWSSGMTCCCRARGAVQPIWKK